MSKRYKVLGAMLALKSDFTVEDLARFSGVKAATVYNYITRTDYVEEIGSQQSGKPGGQRLLYRVKPNRIDDLRAEVESVLTAIPAEAGIKLETRGIKQPEDFKEPLGLQTAEDAIHEYYPLAESAEEQSHILKVAEIDLHGALAETGAILTTETDLNVVKPILKRIIEARKKIESLKLKLPGSSKIEAAEEKAMATTASSAAATAVGDQTNPSPREGTKSAEYKANFELLLAYIQQAFAPAGNLVGGLYKGPIQKQRAKIMDDPEILIIDAIEDEEDDRLTDRISGALQNHSVQRIKADQLPSLRSVRQTAGACDVNQHGICLVTVDSNQDADRAKDTCASAIELCSSVSRVLVFDASSNPELRNRVKELNAHYEGFALDLNEKAILSTLRRWAV